MKNYAFMIMCLLGISLVFFSGCKEDALLEEGEPTMNPTESPTKFFDTELNGVIKDTDGAILKGVTIQAGGKEVVSNDFGFFTLKDIDAPNTGLYIKAEKDGYFVGGSHYFPQKEGKAQTEITLIEKQVESFSAANEVQVELQGGATLNIPAEGFTLNGEKYTGQVQISSTWLNPEDQETFRTMPGALLGVNEAGEEQILQTYGMMAVEMEDTQGNTLELGEGVKAQLSFPLGAGIVGAAPDEIPLWHFDETNGVWIEEGKAIKEDGVYMAEVSHFSWWNCDDPFSVTGLCIEVVDQRGVPINNYSSCITAVGVSLCNPYGHECGLIPSETILTIEFYDICGVVFHTQDIGPFTGGFNDTSTETIVVSLPTYALMNFSGAVSDCTGMTISDETMVSLEINDHAFYDMDITADGYDIDFINCGEDEEEVTITAYDFVNLKEGSASKTLEAGVNNYDLDVAACGQTLAPNLLVLITPDGVVEYEDCTVIQSAAETLIIAKADGVNTTSDLLVGFRGFEVGAFGGNVFGIGFTSGASSGFADQANVTIVGYGDVGEQVRGSFVDGDVSGTFVITRER